MSTDLEAVPTTSSLDPTPRTLWRAARGPVAVGLIVIGGALVLALVAGGPGSGRLDPTAPQPSGSRAVAQVLGDLGVQVDRRTTIRGVVRSTDAVPSGAASTVVVTDPDLLVDEQVDTLLETGADLVLVSPARPERFAPAVTGGQPSATEVRSPGCRLRAARRAGRADTGGFGFEVQGGGDAVLCYARDGVPSLVQIRERGRHVTFLGSPVALTNDRFSDEGNAALALGLLGSHDRLVWYLPSLADVPASAAQTSFYDLVPYSVWWGLVQLTVAALLLALWRGRRLGRVVVEDLPVVVRAAETTEGRARLYRRANARDTAAETLRGAARSRLGKALGVPTRSAPATVVDAVAARTRRGPDEVTGLLYGAAPADDSELVRLADELDALDREVRRP